MSFQIGNIVINRNPEQESEYWFPYRPSQDTQRMENGEFITYDNGRTYINGTLLFKNVKKDEADAFRDFFANTTLYKKFTFSLIPPSFFDCGLGDGVQVDGVTLNTDSASLQGMVTWSGRASLFDLRLDYTFTKQPVSGVVDQGGLIV